ncbi:MAG: hypothetical protein RIK87_09055 [Fuerstiella sp.]
MKTLVALTLTLTASLTQAQDFSNVTSGMLLGIYSEPCSGGMRVNSLIPGYTAEGRLYPGDILKRATVDGLTIHRTRSHYEMENTKRAIGPNRDAALEIYRPGQGLVYVWVQFTPLYGPAAAGTKAFGARYKTEAEKPGARALFQNGRSGGGNPFSGGSPGRNSGGGAARLFGK